MSRIKEALLVDRHIDLWPDTIDADYQYDEWLNQQNEEEAYYAWISDQKAE
jgi:hypothetical protein